MANIKSSQKRIMINNRNMLRNKSYTNRMRTFVKYFETNLENYSADKTDQNKDTLLNSFRDVQANIGKITQKGIMKKNTASRKISRLYKKMNKVITA